LKHGWKKLWRLVRTLSATSVAMAAAALIAAPAMAAPHKAAGEPAIQSQAQNATAQAPRTNELALAGLHPGKDGLALARKLYDGVGQMPSRDDDKNVVVWENSCRRETLRVEADDSGVIQFITAQREEHPRKCAEKNAAPARADRWRTAHGLGIGDDKARVIQIYGEPGSDGPSTGEHREGELMYYAFDWAGSDVPQVMEVYCDRATNRVIEITLSNPSL
jgi:hypothetical protein